MSNVLQQFIEQLSNLKPIEIKPGGGAQFEFEMTLKDPNSKLFLFKVSLNNVCGIYIYSIYSLSYGFMILFCQM